MTNAPIAGADVDVDNCPPGLAALAAAQAKDDFASWLANLRARAVGGLAPSDAVSAVGLRASLAEQVRRLTRGTVDLDDEYLVDYRGPRP
jgi:hypothetical protein